MRSHSIHELPSCPTYSPHSIVAGLLLLATATFGQTTYYVADSGRDANAGTSVATPYQSLTKVNELRLQPGDSVLFRRGDTFRGTLLMRHSGTLAKPIVYAAYGSGPKPVLAGSVSISGWISAGTNVWQAPCTACGDRVTGVFRNDVPLPLGRYPNLDAPNRGYLTIQAHTGQAQVVSKEPLPTGIDWTGGEMAIRPKQWIIDRARISGQVSNSLSLSYTSNYAPVEGWGFFIQNHPATLDQNGEWYYNPAQRQLYLYSSTGIPAATTITATAFDRAIDAKNVSNVAIQKLTISQAKTTNLFAENVANFSVKNCQLQQAGEDGMVVEGTGTDLTIEGNTIADINNNGVVIGPYRRVAFRDNLVRRIAVWPGRGRSGDGQYNGIQSIADEDVTIERNRIDSVGYSGITFWSNTLIQHNEISNYCITKSDGGGLYVWNYFKRPMANVRILSNTIYNGISAPEGTYLDYYTGASGIFLDECVENVLIQDNTVFGNRHAGILQYGNRNISIIRNTVFDNDKSQLVLYHSWGYCPMRGFVIKHNKLIAKHPGQLVAQYESNADDLKLYGDIDSNFYASPFNESLAVRAIINGGFGGVGALTDWRSFSKGHDLHTQPSPFTFADYQPERTGGTTVFNTAFGRGAEGWELVWSRYNTARVATDSSNRLDGASLRIAFPTPSGKQDNVTQVVRRIGAVQKGKAYVLRFDALASIPTTMEVFLRMYGSPYGSLSRTYTVPVGTSRQANELVFVATADNPDAIVMVQLYREDPILWLDNIRLQAGATVTPNDPNALLTIHYNHRPTDSTVALPPGLYRDVQNRAYTDSVRLAPYSAVVLARTHASATPVDLSLSLMPDRQLVPLNGTVTMRLRVRNESRVPVPLSRWLCRLPVGLEVVPTPSQASTDNVLTGIIPPIVPPRRDTLITFMVRPTVTGVFRVAAQISTATAPDPDSSPNSGTHDGEDDMAVGTFQVVGSPERIVASPNPDARPLPDVATNQPAPDPGKANLSLRLVFSHRVPTPDQPVTASLIVSNAGGAAATKVQLQTELSPGLDVADAPGWTLNGRTLTTALPNVPAGQTATVTFQVRVRQSGTLLTRAQITAATPASANSTPGNGYTNGEPDEATAEIRGR
jgi:parallel beta-helix repeat protein